MVHRILIVCALSVAACRSQKSGDPAARGESPMVSTDGRTEAEAAAPDGEQTFGKAGESGSFGTGVTTLFGIKIPTGMYPSRGPEKVYRFEGKLPVARTAALIRDQIVADKEVQEGDGVLFRFAKAAHTRMRTGRNSAVAIRISSSDDGSTLDIWLEREYAKTLPGKAAVADFPLPGQSRSTRRTVMDQKAKQQEQESRALLMRALYKLQKGEPLTPEEAESGVLD